MSVYLISYYLQETSHNHEGCGCDNHHCNDDACDCSNEHNHESCGCGSEHHEHHENCGCGGDADYDLVGEIECLGRWAQFMPTSFLVDCELSADEILDKLSPTVGARDIIFVSKVDSNNIACLTPQVKEWVKKVEGKN